MVPSVLDSVGEYVRLLRPRHWVKNGFVVAPLLFSQQFEQSPMVWRALWAVMGFCAASSAIYVLNDVCDRQEDRRHPVKRERPVASGRVSVGRALLASGLLVGVSLVPAMALGGAYLAMVGAFLILNVLYSAGLKHIAILDVMAITAGFVLRIYAGGVAVAATPSYWLVLCTVMISMFLGFAKRRAELVGVEAAANRTRPVLQDYSVAFLDQVIAMLTAATMICYALYSVDARTVEALGSHGMLFTVPLVMYGLFRYIYLIYHLKEGEDPTGTLYRDVPTLVNLVLWLVLSAVVVRYGEQFDLFG